MSTLLNTNGEELQIPELNPELTKSFYIIKADWNNEITDALFQGAADVLVKAGAKKVVRVKVPGTVELVNAAAMIQKEEDPAAIIVIGCVIRGDTPHFDYVCQIVSQGVAILNAKGLAPVIFGVLTVDNLQQALDRAGGKLGNKGAEAACAAITMSNLHYPNPYS